MNNTPSRPLHILEIAIENVKRLSAVHIKPDGESVVIGGRNAQGKSSVLDAITMALSGAKCAKPVHGDEDKGVVTIDLGDYVVKRTFTPSGGGTLTVTGADGAKFASPQKMLDALLGEISFDPLAFTRMKPKEQLEALRAITGINTAMLDGARQVAYDTRTGHNRRVDELAAQLAGMPPHPDAPEAPISADEILAKLNAANQSNADRAAFIASGKTLAAKVESSEALVARLEKELKEAKDTLEADRERLNKMRVDASETKEIDVSKISEELTTINARNAKLEANTRRAEIEARWNAAKEASALLTAEIEDIDKKKRAKLESAKMPVAGMSLTDDGIEFNGIPFSQASAAEQLRVSVAMGIAANPLLRVLLVRDASLLDAESLALLQSMAEECDAQLWIERVGKGEECTIVIEDGRIEQ